MFGFLVMRLLYGVDIRKAGSGNVGARNAGRFGGKTAFLLIFLGDALKGTAVILLARSLHYSETVQLLGLGCAIIGHIKPITLKLKGGKGVSTFIGGMLAFQPWLASIIISAFLILYTFTKSFTFAGLGSFLTIPIVMLLESKTWQIVLIVAAIVGLVILAHIENMKERLRKHEQNV